MSLCIHPLITARMVIEGGRMTYLRDYGNPRWLPCPFFAVLGGDEPILVDTGASAEVMKDLRAEPVEGVRSFEDCLASLDLKPADIRTVVITHLMYDHCANAKLLPNARFVVQKAELAFARDPHPMLAGAYQEHLFEGLEFDLVEGDHRLAPGVELWFTPGHSQGGQSVAVETEAGLAVITGFCCTMENFEAPSAGAWAAQKEPEVIPPGIHTDMEAAYNSALRVKQAADIIIPFHDSRLENTSRIPEQHN